MNMRYLNTTALLMSLAYATAFAGQSIDEKWDVDADAMISVENVAGEIVIVGWKIGRAHV